ncbi:MAG TPA: cAMP/cGMP-dependent 3',5'-cyclic-AMP/GMP phosphodiesterase [Spirochaetota bacterium]|nr:cAMP/cGMP-dependent 3',5'-cyclic-AMP/GMP phosphodiesterase [Spirochaetota bacterium]HOL57077.1 cAMP/cGMP-dependent 3',5'-cyclic-AMP/GMP phosphodiesterase [Spirochaetota bacterium]HPP04665.1 cAMP/cGMP-dependent 3',5'-cyclic-AMP/GMP phosphodiesterase [Spirochaetota bacterium]
MGNYIELKRGGYLVDLPDCYIQFGVPPETIKDTMLLPKGVPQIFVIMQRMFDWNKGISLAEIEFPIYFNFFIKKRKTIIVCQQEQSVRIKRLLQESIFGPKKLNIEEDIYNREENVIPTVKNEIKYFRNSLKLLDLVDFKIFKNNMIEFDNIKIQIENWIFKLYYNNNYLGDIPSDFVYKPNYLIGERLKEPYIPPLFSITCLGASHGFDPTENSSGYIIWLNHNGIMIDPPVDSTEWLRDSNVNPKLIDSIILTHCHADHDAGTFQKILEEGKITIYSTKTVMTSFLRKYSSLSDIKEKDLLKLFNFYKIEIGKPIFIHGARFDFFYTLHSIPTIGFKMEFQNQKFVYSSDHNNDPSLHKKLLEEGIISKERYEQFCNFPWDSNVIYHEAGIPPLHTPVSYLDSLPEEIKKRIVVYHIAKKDFPKNTSLSLAKFGIENTLVFKTNPPVYERSYQILNILKHLDFFHDISLNKVQEFITIVEEEKFKKGDLIVKKGTKGDKFYIIYSGNVSVIDENLESKKIYGTYEYFGEVSLIMDKERAADIIAETDVSLFSIKKDKFLNFISGTEFEKTLNRLIKIRSSETWNLLSTSPFFKQCSSYQKTWLESIFIPMTIEKPSLIQKENIPFEYIYIIQEGEVEVTKNSYYVKTLKRGDFIGSMQKIFNKKPAEYSFKNITPIKLFAMKKDDIISFVHKNPGLMMKLNSEF